MRVLERGGAAASQMMHRLRQAEQRIEPLEVSPDSLLLYREQDVLAPLLEWSGADAMLRPVTDAMDTKRTSVGAADFHPRRRIPTIPPPQDSRSGTPPLEDSQSNKNSTRAKRVGHLDACPTRFAQVLLGGSLSSPASPLEAPAQIQPNAVDRQSHIYGGVDQQEAMRRIDAMFDGDEQLLRAWNTEIAGTPASPRIAQIIEQTGSVQIAPESAPEDPVSVLLKPVVERAWRQTVKTTAANLPGSKMLRADSLSQERAALDWNPRSPNNGAPRQFGEPARTSALRRLAAYGEVLEAEPPSDGPRENPVSTAPTRYGQGPAPQRSGVAFERNDLAREVADIFRREALRHGIVAEEDTP